MRVPLDRLAGLALAALLLASAGTAQAQGKGHGKGHDKNQHAQVRDDHDRDHHHDGRYENRRGSDGRYENRRLYEHRYEQGRRPVPPGLAKKPGGMPPGQYKKLYTAGQGASVLSDVLGRHGYYVVRTANAGDSRYVYYRDRAGTVRRATVTPSGDRLRFSAVPAALLQEIHARMY
jgi:hypothetical protein